MGTIPLSLALGTSITKWAFRLWLRDTPFADLSGELSDVVRKHIDGVVAGRKTGRQFDEIAEVIGDRLAPIIEVEFRNLNDGERAAAAAAANRTFAVALERNLDPVRYDLEAAVLEKEIRKHDPEAATKALLSADATSLYDLLVSDGCAYMVATCASLPYFQVNTSKELLSRTSHILALATEALNRLPPSMPETWGQGSADEIFSNRYAKAVVQRNDRLQIFGVRDANYRASYSLSVAYLSLTSTIPGSGSPERMRPNESGVDELDEPSPSASSDSREKPDNALSDSVRVEAALGGNARLIVGGEAGSGKTTLLQWIAVTACQRGFVDNLEEWNGAIPFLLPLRRFSKSDFPPPEKFVAIAHPALAGAMPDQWVHRVLASGNGIVLIDGLDELPEAKRAKAKEWLLDLIDTFPNSKYVVTSRPLAVSTEWTSLPFFKYTVLQPMERADIRAFVSHWHRAAGEFANNEEQRAELEQAEKHMLASVVTLPHIAMLSTSPLLCALICAMHRQSANKLPANRMELYDAALQMLLSSRDEERDVELNEFPELTYDERRALLADFALWLHESGESDAEERILYRRVAAKIPQLPRRSHVNPNNAARLLLERSGVLRIPVEGRVDFVHRTFLEYLAAAQLVDDEALDKIVSNADRDQWREVVVMSAGHFGTKSREQLLTRLVERGKDEPKHQHTLFLLAVACLETSPVLPTEVQEVIHKCLDEIVPPKNMGDASSVASAGNLAVPRLHGHRLLATQAAASVRALSLIGTDEALEAIKYYGKDSRVTVSRELVRAWGRFDNERYAKEVLAQSPLESGYILINDPDNLAHLDHLTYASSVFLDFPGKVSSLADLQGSPLVFGINASRAVGLKDLKGIERFPEMRTVWIENTPSLRSIDGVTDCAHINTFYLNGSGVTSFDPLSAFSSLKNLHIEGTPARSLNFLDGIDVASLRAGGLELASIGQRRKVARLILSHSPNLEDIQAISTWNELSSARICTADIDLPDVLTLPPNLETLRAWSHDHNLLALAGGDSLHGLEVSGPRLQFAEQLPSLRYLSVSHFAFERMSVDSVLDACPKLTQITISGRNVGTIEVPEFTRVAMRGRPPSLAIFMRSSLIS